MVQRDSFTFFIYVNNLILISLPTLELSIFMPANLIFEAGIKPVIPSLILMNAPKIYNIFNNTGDNVIHADIVVYI